ncbi:MAG: DUF624 domain-containing protein [Clostridia bacterium]
MTNLFRYDGPVVTFLLKIGELFVLNILWLLCCLPIVTAGAATTALCRVVLNNLRKQGRSYRDFFQVFRLEFRQSTLLWLVFAVVGAALIFNWYFVFRLNSSAFRIAFFVVLCIVSFVYVVVLTFVFPLQAQFDNSICNTIKNAFLMSMANPLGTIVMVLFNAIPLLLIYFFDFGFLLLSIDVALVAAADAMIFSRIFDLYIDANTVEKHGNLNEKINL